MKFAAACTLTYEVTGPVTFLLSIRARAGSGQTLTEENLRLAPGLEHSLKTCKSTGTAFDRIHAPAPGTYEIHYQATVETAPKLMPAFSLVDGGPESFETSVLPYLYPSRYCQSDRLGKLAFDMFGKVEGAEARVRAIVEWISSRLTYLSGSTNSSTSALDSVVERLGVCRDYAHLGIALSRALNIPARYFTGYAHQLNPPDFHACFETWIGSRWLFWDATGLASPDGVVRIGTGRDASDCSVCTSFGPLILQNQEVSCKCLDSNYQMMDAAALQTTTVSLEPGQT